jgi:hypothetical protein
VNQKPPTIPITDADEEKLAQARADERNHFKDRFLIWISDFERRFSAEDNQTEKASMAGAIAALGEVILALDGKV